MYYLYLAPLGIVKLTTGSSSMIKLISVINDDQKLYMSKC